MCKCWKETLISILCLSLFFLSQCCWLLISFELRGHNATKRGFFYGHPPSIRGRRKTQNAAEPPLVPETWRGVSVLLLMSLVTDTPPPHPLLFPDEVPRMKLSDDVACTSVQEPNILMHFIRHAWGWVLLLPYISASERATTLPGRSHSAWLHRRSHSLLLLLISCFVEVSFSMRTLMWHYHPRTLCATESNLTEILSYLRHPQHAGKDRTSYWGSGLFVFPCCSAMRVSSVYVCQHVLVL